MEGKRRAWAGRARARARDVRSLAVPYVNASDRMPLQTRQARQEGPDPVREKIRERARTTSAEVEATANESLTRRVMSLCPWRASRGANRSCRSSLRRRTIVSPDPAEAGPGPARQLEGSTVRREAWPTCRDKIEARQGKGNTSLVPRSTSSSCFQRFPSFRSLL